MRVGPQKKKLELELTKPKTEKQSNNKQQDVTTPKFAYAIPHSDSIPYRCFDMEYTLTPTVTVYELTPRHELRT